MKLPLCLVAAISLLFIGTVSVTTNVAAAQTAPGGANAAAERSKRMYPGGDVFEVVGTVAAAVIVNDIGTSTTAAQGYAYRIRLNVTSRRNVVTNTIIGTTDGPYCGAGSAAFAYADGNEQHARAMYSQALLGRATGETVTLWVERESSTVYCHLYALSFGSVQ